MIFKNVWVGEVCISSWLSDYLKVPFIGIIAVQARFDFDNFGSVFSTVKQADDFVHLRKATATDLSQVFELLFESLYNSPFTFNREAFFKSKPSIYNQLSPHPSSYIAQEREKIRYALSLCRRFLMKYLTHHIFLERDGPAKSQHLVFSSDLSSK